MMRRIAPPGRGRIRWCPTPSRMLPTAAAFVDAGGMEVLRVRVSATIARLPPYLPELDADLRPVADAGPELLEVVDLRRAVRRLAELGFEVGPIEPSGWEGLADLELDGIGRFRLVGPWVPEVEA